MEKKIFRVKYLFILSLMLAASAATSQEATKQEILDFSQRYAQAFWARKAEAVRIATEKGWPVRQEFPDGRIIQIVAVGADGVPEYETTDNNDAAVTSGTNNLWPGGAMGLSLTGSTMLIGEWDGGGVRTTHQEFRVGIMPSRVTQRDAPAGLSDHSTHVAGTLVAEGQDADAHGMAPAADLDAYDWDNDIGEMGTAYANDDLKLSNHSYGRIRGWDNQGGTMYWFGDITISTTEDYQFGFYGPLAKTWDSLARLCPYYLICKSAGNDRNDDWNSGHYVLSGGSWVWSTASRDPDGGTDGYDCLENRSVAKNILTVGAVEEIPGGYTQPSDVVMTDFSGWGPTDDGRIKPDLVADGDDLYSSISTVDNAYDNKGGTSMSSPVVCGSMALLQEYHYSLNAVYMHADELKALVINTADEAGAADGPDYQFGWGLLNTDGAAALIRKDDSIGSLIRRSYLTNGETETFTYYSDGNHPLKVTICWIDPAHDALTAALNPTTICLVHDLDLRVINPSGGVAYPWRLTPTTPGNAAVRADNYRDNVETVYVVNPAPGMHTIQITHEGTISGQYYGLVISGLQTQRFENVWTGGASTDYWYLDANWSLGHDPVISEDALIPDGSGFHALVDILDGYCHDLEVGADAMVELHDDSLTIDNNLLLWGELEMDMDAGRVIINGSAYNYTAATLDIQAANCMIWVSGSWRFYGGVNANMTNGTVNFTGTGISYIYSYDDDASFNRLGIYKSGGGYAEHSDASTYPLRTNNYFYLHSNSEFRSNTTQPIIVKGYFSKATTATCHLNMGTIVMDGTATNIYFNGDGWFHDLTISPATSITLQNDISVHGDLLIEQGALVAGTHKINLRGNWTNTVGDAGFNETGSRVIFDNGDGSSYINSGENFDTLDIAIFDAVYINDAADNVTCDHLYVTGGAMNVSAGSFTADDLVQNGLYGGWAVSGTGTVNLHQDAGQLIDLYGWLNISAGTMNIYGGADNSYWGYAAANTVTMSGGVLDFVNQGVSVYSSYAFTDNISAGTIRTAKGFRVYRGDFNPTGGTVYFTGSSDGYINHNAGSNFYSITLNKYGADDGVSPVPDGSLVRDAEDAAGTDDSPKITGLIRKKPAPGSRSNTITLSSSLDINGSVLIDNGILDVSASNFSVNCAGNWTDNVDLGIGFNERAGTVTFDGASSRSLYTETFYNMSLNKTYASTNGLILQDGELITVMNDLTVTDGTIEIEPGTVLDIRGDLGIASGAGINADDIPAEVRIKGDWTDNNVTVSGTAGFNPGYNSTVLFYGTADQYLNTAAAAGLFNHVTLDLTTAYFTPQDNLELRGDLNILTGTWYDGTAGLTHSFRGDFTVASAGGFSTTPGTTVRFIGSSDQVISWSGSNGYFSDLIIDKSITDGSGRTNTVSLATPIYLFNGPTLSINFGTLDLNGQFIRATGDVKIYNGGVMSIGDDAWLEVGGSDSLIVYSGGTLEVVGAAGHEAGIKGHNSQNYAFNLESGGNLSARYGIFQHMDANGLNCKTGSLVNATNDFDFCTFKNGYNGTGTLLKIDNSQALNVEGAAFPVDATTTSNNVTKSLNQGTVNFTGATGARSGPAFESDPFGRIFWAEHGRWDGSVSTSWSTGGNWGFDIVPTSTIDAVIPAGCPNYPVLAGSLTVNSAAGTYDCKSLTIDDGANLSFSTSSILYNYGTVAVDGKLSIGDDYRGFASSLLVMTGDSIKLGTVGAVDGRFLLYNGSAVDQTEGHILAESYQLESGCDFTQYGSYQHLYKVGTSPTQGAIIIHEPDIHFSTFLIDSPASGFMSTSTEDLECFHLSVSGTFNNYGKDVLASYLDSYGTVQIDSGMIHVTTNGPYFHASDGTFNMTGGTLEAGDTVRWYSGSVGNITGGSIYAEEKWKVYDGADVAMGAGHTTYFNEPLETDIICEDASSTFGTVVFNKPSAATSDISILSSASTPMRVAGNLSIGAGNQCILNGDMIVAGEFINAAASETDVNAGSGLEIGGDLTLNGSLQITDGDVVVHGDFEETVDGDISITGGSFVCDHSLGESRAMYYLRGDFAMSSGIFEITQNHLNFSASAAENITGGTIRVGGTFSAPAANFTPSGGTLEMIDYPGGGYPYVEIHASNHLYNLTISGPDTWLVSGAGADKLTIRNDLTINSGCLDGADDTLYVADDWINNAGTGGFTCGTGLVVLNGTVPTPEMQQITGATTFYDLTNMNAVADVRFDGPVTVSRDYLAAAGGATCETVVSGSPVNINGQLKLPQGYFSLSAAAPVVNVASLDQGGGISVTGGALNIADIIESGLYGVYTLYNGSISITQESSSFVDLFGDIYISNGAMNILGGTDRTYWPGSGTHIIQISGGEMNFQDIGVYLQNNNMAYDITGGKIRTGGDFISMPGVSVFDPSGGSVEMYGTGAGNVSLGAGSYFHDLTIDKPSVTAYATSALRVKGALNLRQGTLRTNGYAVTVGP